MGTYTPVTALSTSLNRLVITFLGGRQLGGRGRVLLNMMVSLGAILHTTTVLRSKILPMEIWYLDTHFGYQIVMATTPNVTLVPRKDEAKEC